MDNKPKVKTADIKCRPGPNGGGCTRPQWPPVRPLPYPPKMPGPRGRRRGGGGGGGCIIA